MQSLGKYLIAIGVIIVVVGLILAFFPKMNFFGKMPGDIQIKRENFSFYFPIVTCILISTLLTLVFWFVNFISKK